MELCLFTIEHPKARRIYIKGVADITQPIEEYSKIIKFNDGVEKKSELPKNPYNKGETDYNLFEELLSSIKTHFEEIGDELVFAETFNKSVEFVNKTLTDEYIIEMEKVIV